MEQGDKLLLWGLLILGAWCGAVSMVEAQGYWETVVNNAGIATMHAAVTHYGNVVLLDRTNVGPSQLNLAPGVCRDNPQDRVHDTITSKFNLDHHIIGSIIFIW